MGLRAFRRGAAAAAVATLPVGLGATAAGAETGSATQRQTFTFTSQQTGQAITCGIEHAVTAQVTAQDRLLVDGSTEVDEGPAVCDDSAVSIVYVLDDGSGDDLSQYAYGAGGYAGFSNHFPSSWTFHQSSHRVYFNACRCYAPTVNLHPK